MTAKADRSYPIAKANPLSSLLMVRRAAWANKHGYPKHNGHAIAPRWVNNDAEREAHQDAVNYWWWYELDDRARGFLGDQYFRDVTTADPAPVNPAQPGS